MATKTVNPPAWIDIEERMPELGQAVCFFSRSSGAWVGTYSGRNGSGHKFSSFGGLNNGDVTHWFAMPPRPPRFRAATESVGISRY